MFKIVFIASLFFNTVASAFTWPEATPSEVGLDATYINSAIELIDSGQMGNIRSLIIIKDGKLVTEKYFGNQGGKRPIYSVTKSIGSALLGIAKYQGATINLDDSIMNYLPQYNNISNVAQVNEITLHDLLTQRHGYNWDEWSVSFGNPRNPVYQMMRTSDWYKFALEWPINNAPNTKFKYSSGHSSLMSPILYNRTGEDVYQFAIDELFIPLEISDTHWELVNDGAVQGQGVAQFPFGLEPLGFGLWLRPIDMAKFGELYRQGGIWNGNRLLTSDWVEKSTQIYSNGTTDGEVFDDEFSGYGYQWWRFRFVDQQGYSTDAFYANGYARQYIFVFPELNTTIVSTAHDYVYDGPGIGTVLREQLLLAFDRSDDQPIAITNDLNGSWHWPENSGQGIDFQILNDNNNITGFWYTYNQEGGTQRWFTFQGDVNNDAASFTIYTTTGGGFVVADPPELVVWGTGSLVAYDCNSGLFSFESTAEAASGEIPLSRLTASTGSCLSTTNKRSKKTYNLADIP